MMERLGGVFGNDDDDDDNDDDDDDAEKSTVRESREKREVDDET